MAYRVRRFFDGRIFDGGGFCGGFRNGYGIFHTHDLCLDGSICGAACCFEKGDGMA